MNKNPKGRKIAFLTLIVLISAAVLIYINNSSLDSSAIRVSGKKVLAVASELAVASNNSDLFFCMDELMIEAQGTVIRARKVTGEQAWSMSLGGVVMRISSAGESILVLDDKNKLYYMSRQGKIIWDYALQSEPWNIFGEDNGCILIEYKDISGSKIEVFNSKGTALGKAALKNAYVISFGAGSEDRYTISVVDITSENLKSRLITYNSAGQMVWAKDFNNEIISYVHFLKNNNILAAVSNKLLNYGNDGNIVKEVKLDGKLQNISASTDTIVIVINERGKYSSVIFDGYLEKYGQIKLEIVPKGIFVHENNYILYDKDKLLLGNVNDSIVTTYKSVSDIVSAYMTSRDSMYIVSNRKLQALQFN